MSGLADPADPNYFRLSNIDGIRGELSTLRDYIAEPGDFDEDELCAIANRLLTLAWPASQPGFDAGLEADRAFLAQLDALGPAEFGEPR